MLELRGVTKTWGRSPAVDKVDLIINEGEFFSLLGPSGCGKTTLLRMIGGFENPTGGALFLDGVRLDTLPPHRRNINMVFQRYALFPHLSVEENVAFGLRIKKVPKSKIETRVAEALELVRMRDYSKRAIATLSGGQQQRIALARALVNRPKILLLDEPLSALDLKLRQQMQVELVALQRQLRITFIFVTHDQDEALTLSDRIAVMNGGHIEQTGSPHEIYEYPRSEFVARFIGSINTFSGEVAYVHDDVIMITNGSKRPVTVKPSRDGTRTLPHLNVGGRVRLMVRPEKLKVLKSQPAQDANYMEGIAREILYKGPVTQYFVDTSSSALMITQMNAAATTRKPVNVGDRIFVAWQPEDCLVIESPVEV